MTKDPNCTAFDNLLNDTIKRLTNISETQEEHGKLIAEIPSMKLLLETSSSAQTVMAASAQSMAETFQKTEARAEIQDKRHQELIEIVSGKDQIPLKSHYLTIAAICLCAILYALSINNQDLDASLTELSVKQSKTLGAVQEVQKEIQTSEYERSETQ